MLNLPGKGEELRLALAEMELAPGTKCLQGKDIGLFPTPLRTREGNNHNKGCPLSGMYRFIKTNSLLARKVEYKFDNLKEPGLFAVFSTRYRSIPLLASLLVTSL